MNKVRLYKQLLSLVFLSFLVLTIYNIISGYVTTERQVRQLTLDRLDGIATNLASQIDGELHQKVTSHFKEIDAITFLEQCSEYKVIHQMLSKAHEDFQLKSPIYTFVKSKEKVGDLEFIATSNEEPYYRHLYTTFPKNEFANLDQGGVLDLYEDEFGHWLSAYAPIKNKSGEVVGYLQADEKFDDLTSVVFTQSFKEAGWSLLGLSLITLFILPLLKKIVRHEEHQKAKLAKSLREITQLSKQLQENEDALKENAAQLEQSNKDLNDFAHIASHDLKAPMRNILSFSQLLNRKADHFDEDEKTYLKYIISSADRAQKLITGLLKYSTADKDMDKGEVFEMKAALDEALLGLKTILEEKNVQVIINELPVAEGNLILISQVLQNLINNGIKYNESPKPIIEIGSGQDAKKGAYFYVKDNGIGIPEKYQQDIFKMFKRLHTTGTYEGSGIGLAFCTRVINSYSGDIWLESFPDVGSTFFFTLPKAMVNQNAEESSSLKGELLGVS